MPIAALTVLILDEFTSTKLCMIHIGLIAYVAVVLVYDACCTKLMTVLKSPVFHLQFISNLQ